MNRKIETLTYGNKNYIELIQRRILELTKKKKGFIPIGFSKAYSKELKGMEKC